MARPGWRLILTAVILLPCGGPVLADEPPRIEHVGMVAPNIIGLTIMAGRAEYGRQNPYEKQAGDIVLDPQMHRFVRRGNKIIGTLAGKNADILCTMDSVVGERFDTKWADRTNSYSVISADDPHYAAAQRPKSIFRKSKPSDLAMIGQYKFDSPTENVVYLEMPSPLASGKRYEISFPGSGFGIRKFVFDSTRLWSEAVHVNQVGYRPDDPAKTAFLSCWLGNGGGLKYEDRLPYSVIDEATGKAVFEGSTILSKAATDKTEDAYKKNYNGTDVFEMDFTALTRPGKYRVSVRSVGCSYPFEISDNVWRDAFIVAARGFYHQRSGIAIGEPFTPFKRPRPFHPDDGLKVYASTAPLMDTGNGINQKDSNFGNLVKGRTDQIVTNAWGGYMDAGDWDRRIQHLKATSLLLELAEIFPDYFGALSLHIPESGNGLPDIVNEALFNLDFFARLQTPEGGIRGGIESSEHPRRGEASFQESLAVMTYAPDIFSSYFYAGVAARAALWLQPRHSELAGRYRASALRAMRWAEGDREREEKTYLMAKHPAVGDLRNFAAAELFRLTGEPEWNRLFLDTTLFKTADAVPEYHFDSLEQYDSAWVYARTDRPGMDATVKSCCRVALLKAGDERAASGRKTGFHWTKNPYGPVVYGALSSPENAVNIVRAHVLSGDPKYLRAIVLASQTGAGANPVNMCYTTGLGTKSPQHPLQLDHRITLQPPPPGLTVGGPMDNDMKGLKDPFIGPFAGSLFCPPYTQWPALEAFWDVFWDPMQCEYTIHKPMAGHAYVWGYLAGRAPLAKSEARLPD